MTSKENFRFSTQQALELSKISEYSALLRPIATQSELVATRCVEPAFGDPNSLVFISKPEHLPLVEEKKPTMIIAAEDLQLPTFQWPVSVFKTQSIAASLSLVLPFFDGKKLRFPNLIHSSAVIASTANVGKNVRIGAYSVIGENTEIGDGAIIGPFCNIERDSKVGPRSLLHSHVFLGAHCVIGHDSEIHPFTSIGSDGFGYVQDKTQKRHKIPQIGIVRIGNFVEIGASCTIDRATLHETLIEDGTKIDNLCHFAHNVKIGKNGAITAGFNIAGSSRIGDNFMCGGQTGVADHIQITDNVLIGARGGVTKDVTVSGAYAGFPLEPMRNAVRTLASLPYLAELRKTVSQIQKKINLE